MASGEEVREIAEQIEQAANRLAAPYEEIAMLARRLQSASGGGGDTGGGSFDPLADIAWTAAFWADDPDWSNPGDGGSVTSWRDAGSEGKDAATGVAPTFRSSTAAFNSRATVEFDGGDWLVTPAWTTTVTGTTTVFIVGQFTSLSGTPSLTGGRTSSTRREVRATSTQYLLYAGNGSARYGGTSDTNAHHFYVTFNVPSHNYLLEEDGVLDYNRTYTGTANMDGVTLGSIFSGNDKLTGHLAFVGVYSGTLSSGDKADLVAWAESYYAL